MSWFLKASVSVELAPLAFFGEQQHAHHLVDELVASGAIDVDALVIRIGLQNLIQLAGSEFGVAHLNHHAVRRQARAER